MRIDRINLGEYQTDDQGVYEEAWAVTTIYTKAEMDEYMAAYQSDVATSPGVAWCRPPIRLMCAKQAEGAA